MKSRKGMPKNVTWIILVFIMFVFAVLILVVFEDVDVTDFKTLPCTLSNRIKGMLPTKALNALPGTMGLTRFCVAQEKIIDPQKWEKCNAEFEAASGVNMVDAVRNCTMQQVLDLSLRCWDAGGRGKYHPGSFMCYYGVVKVGETTDLDIKDEAQLRMLYEDEVRRELGCMPGDSDWCILEETKAGCMRNEVVRDIANSHAKLVKANSLSMYFHGLITNNRTATGYDSDGYLVYCAKEGVDTTELNEGLFLLENPTEAQVAGLVYSSLDLTKSGCNESISRIRNSLNNVTYWGEKASTAKDEIRARLEGCVKEGEEIVEVADAGVPPPVIDYVAKAEKIAFLMDETTRLTVAAPSPGMMGQSELREFAKHVKNPKTGMSYAFELGADNLEFIGDYKIGPNSMFEMAFCDGAAIASGIMAMDVCSVRDETIIQIGAVGSGAGGVGSAQSPFCSMTSVLKSVPGAHYVHDFCEARYWKIERPTQ